MKETMIPFFIYLTVYIFVNSKPLENVVLLDLNFFLNFFPFVLM